MAELSLDGFLQRLTAAGELRRVTVPVAADLELAAVTTKLARLPGGAPALYWQQVASAGGPLVSNLYGSERRLCLALQVPELSGLTPRYAALLAAPERELAPWLPEAGPADDGLEELPATAPLPFLQLWPADGVPGGRQVLTLSLVVSSDPHSGQIDWSLCRVQRFADGLMGLHWHPGSRGWRHWQAWRQRGEQMPVAVLAGVAPACQCAALIPRETGLEPSMLAGWLQQAPIACRPARSLPLSLPTGTALALEGWVAPDAVRDGGSFANHSGRYQPVGEVPLLRLTSCGRRPGTPVPVVVNGPPPTEAGWLGRLAEPFLLASLQRVAPEVTALRLEPSTAFSTLLVAAHCGIGGSGRLLERLRCLAVLRRYRLLVLVDAALPLGEPAAVLAGILNGVAWQHDLCTDGAGPAGLDASGWEAGGRPAEAPVSAEPQMEEYVTRRWQEYGLD